MMSDLGYTLDRYIIYIYLYRLCNQNASWTPHRNCMLKKVLQTAVKFQNGSTQKATWGPSPLYKSSSTMRSSSEYLLRNYAWRMEQYCNANILSDFRPSVAPNIQTNFAWWMAAFRFNHARAVYNKLQQRHDSYL